MSGIKRLLMLRRICVMARSRKLELLLAAPGVPRFAGTAKGRKLKSPGDATRPITDRVKENLFNILRREVIGANVLDLFAGAGSVGIEALSRGAAFAEELHERVFTITPKQLMLLTDACRGHTTGFHHADPTIGACWDASRPFF